jgi:hypothetical protein
MRVRELPGEARLAHPGLTDERHYLTVTGARELLGASEKSAPSAGPASWDATCSRVAAWASFARRTSRRCLRGSVADTLLSAAMQVQRFALPRLSRRGLAIEAVLEAKPDEEMLRRRPDWVGSRRARHASSPAQGLTAGERGEGKAGRLSAL